MSGGGSQTTKVDIPDWLEAAAQRAIGRAEDAAQVGYLPWTGPDVAAFTPMQNAAFSNTNAAASAFGLANPSGTGMPRAQEFSGGVHGYASYPMFEEAMTTLQASRPGQYGALNDMFMDPVSGKLAPRSAGPRSAAAPVVYGDGGQGDDEDHSWNTSRSSSGMTRPRARPTGGGYTDLGDMFDGGGPGASGGAYKGGGLLSSAANRFTGRR